MLKIRYIDFVQVLIVISQLLKGIKGQRGSQGDPGLPGQNGVPGKNGDTGLPGEKGLQVQLIALTTVILYIQMSFPVLLEREN